MRTKGLLNYNDICEMGADCICFDELGNGASYNDWLSRYCMNAAEYVDMMKDKGFDTDFGVENIEQIVIGILLFHLKNLKDGVDPEDSIEAVKVQIAGYYLFCIYNSFILDGCRVGIELKEDNSGLCLYVEDEDEGVDFVCDIPDAIERAFEHLEFEQKDTGGEMRCDERQFFGELLDIM